LIAFSASRPFFGLVIHANLAKREGLKTNAEISFYTSLDKPSVSFIIHLVAESNTLQ